MKHPPPSHLPHHTKTPTLLAPYSSSVNLANSNHTTSTKQTNTTSSAKGTTDLETLLRDQNQTNTAAFGDPSSTAGRMLATDQSVPTTGPIRPQDSLSISQLKRLVEGFPEKKTPRYTFAYADTDCLANEIDEYYSYVEIWQCQENRKLFERAYNKGWTELADTDRRQMIVELLETLELTNADQRFEATRRLLYIAQGTFGEYSNSQRHLYWILKNNKLLREEGALIYYFQMLRHACSTHEMLGRPDCTLPVQERVACIENANAEIGFCMTLLYMLVVSHMDDDRFGSELASTEPPLAAYLFGLVSALRERNSKGYPVKKLLLLLWKVVLSSLGGTTDLCEMKKLACMMNGLQATNFDDNRAKASIQGFQMFQQQVSQKYPTYTIPKLPIPIPTPLPIPVIPAVSATVISKKKKASAATQNAPLPDQPFIFPFTMDGPMVPLSIEEAGEMFLNSTYCSLGTLQIKRAREISEPDAPIAIPPNRYDEGGDVYMEDTAFQTKTKDEHAVEDLHLSSNDKTRCESKTKAKNTGRPSPTKENVEDKYKMKLDHVEVLVQHILPNMQNIVIVLLKLLLATMPSGDKNTTTNAGNSNSNSVHYQSSLAEGGLGSQKFALSEGNRQTNTLAAIEGIDIIRHREITSKAVSGILILLLKNLKRSHILLFEYASQLLLDSNCILLVLKLLGVQDLTSTVSAQNDIENLNFFQYCRTRYSPSSSFSSMVMNTDVDKLAEMNNSGNGNNGNGSGMNNDIGNTADISVMEEQLNNAFPKRGDGNNNLEEACSGPPKQQSPLRSSAATDSVLPSCWRNFFGIINFLRVLQKLTKRKTHRILLLVQYKSSAILKRVLKVQHPPLQYYALKILKSQVPFLGRKWRQANMKVVSAIYLNLRPTLCDDWLYGTDTDADGDEAVLQEETLRSLSATYIQRQLPHLFHREESAASLDETDEQARHRLMLKDSAGIGYSYGVDDQMLDAAFLEHYEEWLQEEVYNVKKPVDVIKLGEYVDDDLTCWPQPPKPPGGEGWDVPVTHSDSWESDDSLIPSYWDKDEVPEHRESVDTGWWDDPTNNDVSEVELNLEMSNVNGDPSTTVIEFACI